MALSMNKVCCGATGCCGKPTCVAARGLAVLLLFFGFADALSTEATLLLGGAEEMNPLINAMRDVMGSFWILPKMAGHGLLAGLTVRFSTASMLATMAALTLTLTIVTSNNATLLADAFGLYAKSQVLRLY